MATVDSSFSHRDSVVVRVPCAAPAAAAWELLGTPARWPEWSPQVRAVGGFDAVRRRLLPAPPELEAGRWVVVYGPWPVRLRARFTRVDTGRRWDFAAPLPAGLTLLSAHEVEPVRGGCQVVWGMRAEGPGGVLVTRTMLAAYGPLVRLALRRLARSAERQAPLSGAARP
jgi:hypothetical protein